MNWLRNLWRSIHEWNHAAGELRGEYDIPTNKQYEKIERHLDEIRLALSHIWREVRDIQGDVEGIQQYLKIPPRYCHRYSVVISQVSPPKFVKSFSTKLKEIKMATTPTPTPGTGTTPGTPTLNGFGAGGSGTFHAELQDNGSAVSTQPTTWTWSTNDPSATVTADTSDTTGATVVVTVPATDTSTSLIITATTTAPDGTSVNGSLTVPLSAGVNKFTVVITQTK